MIPQPTLTLTLSALNQLKDKKRDVDIWQAFLALLRWIKVCCWWLRSPTPNQLLKINLCLNSNLPLNFISSPKLNLHLNVNCHFSCNSMKNPTHLKSIFSIHFLARVNNFGSQLDAVLLIWKKTSKDQLRESSAEADETKKFLGSSGGISCVKEVVSVMESVGVRKRMRDILLKFSHWRRTAWWLEEGCWYPRGRKDAQSVRRHYDALRGSSWLSYCYIAFVLRKKFHGCGSIPKEASH